MNKEQQYLISVVRYILHNRTIETPIPSEDLDWGKLISLANRHSVQNLLFYGIENLEQDKQVDGKLYHQLMQIMMQEIVRSCNQLSAAEELLQKFEKENIYAIALKGVNTKKYYPETDVRSMGDIDILYKDSQHELLQNVMIELGYHGFEEGRKHDHFYRAPFIQVEMHREMVATESDYSSYYADIWQRVHPRAGCIYIHEMDLEDQYIYVIIHLVEHFKNGGVGIRFIMDVFIYDQMENLNRNYIKAELEKLQLWDFYSNISDLAKMWFGTSKQEYTPEQKKTLEELAQYIIDNGTYGSRENRAALSVEESGRFRFLFKAFFPNLKSMQSMYPWLKKYPFLLPWSWIHRGIRSYRYRRNNIKSQMNVYKTGDIDHGRELRQFYRRCGL